MSKPILECFGSYGSPSSQYKCEKCSLNELCRKVYEDFIPRSSLTVILEKLNRIERLLGGVRCEG